MRIFWKTFYSFTYHFLRINKNTYKNNSEIPNQTFNKKDYVTHASLNIYVYI